MTQDDVNMGKNRCCVGPCDNDQRYSHRQLKKHVSTLKRQSLSTSTAIKLTYLMHSYFVSIFVSCSFPLAPLRDFFRTFSSVIRVTHMSFFVDAFKLHDMLLMYMLGPLSCEE